MDNHDSTTNDNLDESYLDDLLSYAETWGTGKSRITDQGRRNRTKPATEKKCRRCRRTLALSEYRVIQVGSQQLMTICAECEDLRKKRWRRENRVRIRAAGHRYRARKRSLPSTFSIEDWQIALDHFGHSCAVCGQGLLFFAHQDHWIPINSSKCPGTVPHNMVPLCSTCNNSKRDTPPAEWLKKKYGGRKGAAILKRVEAFLESRKPLKEDTA